MMANLLQSEKATFTGFVCQLSKNEFRKKSIIHTRMAWHLG